MGGTTLTTQRPPASLASLLRIIGVAAACAALGGAFVPATAADPPNRVRVADSRDALRQRAIIEGAERDRTRRRDWLERDRERRRGYDRAGQPSPSLSAPGARPLPPTAEPFAPPARDLAPPDDDVALVRQTQRALRRLGFAPGPIDGRLGPLTRSAVLAYQGDRGLPRTGAPSPALLQRLERDRGASAPP